MSLRPAAIAATAYALVDLAFIDWAGSIHLWVPVWIFVVTLVSEPLAWVAAVWLWTRWLLGREGL